MENASDRMKIYDFDTPAKHLNDVLLPDIGSVGKSVGHYNETELFFRFSSFTNPGTLFLLNMDNYKMEKISEIQIGDANYKSENFKTEQVFYKSKDGTQIPMFLVGRKSDIQQVKDKTRKPLPVLLTGYGGFGVSNLPKFNSAQLMFIRHLGAVVAMPSLRGGGEFGEQWHQMACKERRQNVFDDFIGAAEFLI